MEKIKHKYGYEHPLSGQIQTAGFFVDFYGDESVGIYDQKFTVQAESATFIFDDDREVEEFKELLADAFEIVTGERCGVETFEEQWRRLDAQEKQLQGADPNFTPQ